MKLELIYYWICFIYFFNRTFLNTSVTKIHTWGTGGHAALVYSTFRKSYKHGMNEQTGKRRVDTYPKTTYA